MSTGKYTEAKCLVQIPRTCDRCGHAYTVAREFRGSGGGHGPEGLAKAMADARADAAKYGESNVDRFGVLCPACRRFSSRATSKWFPTGYADGLVAQTRSFWMTLGCVSWVFGGLLSVAGGGLTVFSVVTEASRDAVGFGIIFTLLGLGFCGLPFLPLSRLKTYRGELDAMSDDEVYAVVVATYRKNGNDVSQLVNWTDVLKDVQRNPDNYTGPDYQPPDEPTTPAAEARLRIQCPKCKEPQTLPASARGTTVACASCQARIKIPAAKS